MTTTQPDTRKILRNFIVRAQLLHRKGKPAYYQTMARLQAIDRLQTLLILLPGCKPLQAARLVVRYADDLRRVLPFPSNKTWKKSSENLENLILSSIKLIES